MCVESVPIVPGRRFWKVPVSHSESLYSSEWVEVFWREWWPGEEERVSWARKVTRLRSAWYYSLRYRYHQLKILPEVVKVVARSERANVLFPDPGFRPMKRQLFEPPFYCERDCFGNSGGRV